MFVSVFVLCMCLCSYLPAINASVKNNMGTQIVTQLLSSPTCIIGHWCYCSPGAFKEDWKRSNENLMFFVYHSQWKHQNRCSFTLKQQVKVFRVWSCYAYKGFISVAFIFSSILHHIMHNTLCVAKFSKFIDSVRAWRLFFVNTIYLIVCLVSTLLFDTL